MKILPLPLREAGISQADNTTVLGVGSGLTPGERFVKRLLDILLAFLGLILSLPAFLTIMTLIKLTSRGPIFYRQERVGQNGRLFTLVKFRTMMDNAEAATGPILATADDKRITAIGKPLRSLRLDELPQLFNILRGEMSIVGPRPERPYFVNLFSSSIPAYGQRHAVKPGLTGLAQTLGKYSTRPEDKLKHDLLYIQEYSLFLDLRIMAMTVPVLFRPEASRGVAATQ